MSAISIGELPGSPKASFELGRRKYTREFQVLCSSMEDGPLIASAALAEQGIILFTPYDTGTEHDTEALLRTVTPERIRPGFAAWKFTCEYSTPELKERTGSHDNGGGSGRENPGEFTNPLLELPTVKVSIESREVLLTQIFDTAVGTLKPCTASNGEVFDPPPKVLERYMVLTISRNERLTANHPAIGLMYQDAVNSDTFWRLPPGVWKVRSIVAERQQRQLPGGGQFAYLRCEYSFEGKALKIVNLANLSLPPANTIVSSWDIQLLDYGSYYYITPPPSATSSLGAGGFVAPNGNSPVRMPFRTRDGHPTSGMLDGQGGALPDRVTFTVSGSTLTVPNSSYPFKNGLQVQLWSIGGDLPDPLQPNGAYYVVNSSGPRYVSFQLSETQGGDAIELTDAGSGTLFIGTSGVFLQIRPYNRLPFGLLRLPQSFRQVQ